MTPTETAALLRFGVTKPMIDALEAAGYDSFAKLGPISQDRAALAAVPGMSEADAYQAWRAFGKLIDVSLARLPRTQARSE